MSSHEEIEKVNGFILIGSALLIGFFLLSVKFSIKQAKMMENEPMPRFEKMVWLSTPLSPQKMEGKVLLLFFYKSDVEISRKILAASSELERKYGEKGLLTLLIVSTAEDFESVESRELGRLPNLIQGYYIGVDSQGINGKNYKHGSFATYYLANSIGIIRYVGNAENDGVGKIEVEIKKLLEAL